MYRDGATRPDRLTILVLAASGMLTSLQFTLMVPALPEVAIGDIGLLSWFSAAAGLCFFVLVFELVPASTNRSGGRFDLVGAALLATALSALLLVISKGLVWGLLSPAVLIIAGLGAVCFAIWVPQQLRTRNPVVDLRTSTRRMALQTNDPSFFTSVGMSS